LSIERYSKDFVQAAHIIRFMGKYSSNISMKV